MSQELVTDFLLISRYSEPPMEASVTQAVTSAGLGSASYEPAPLRDPATVPPKREKVGVYTVQAQGTSSAARLVIARHDGPVLDGMGEAALNQLARRLEPDEAQTLRIGSLAIDVRVSGLAEAAVETQRWAAGLLRLLASITEGVVIDPAAETAWGIARLAELALAGPVAHITVRDEAWGADSRWLRTQGLRKFARPELELADIPVALAPEAEAFLLEVAENLAQGQELSAGQEIHLEEAGSSVVAVAAPRESGPVSSWGRLRLADTPLPGERQGVGARRLFTHMALADATRRKDSGDIAGALEVIERALAADSDDCAALALKALIFLEEDNPLEALAVGELMRLRAPEDYRGSLVIGLALSAIGRYPEALNALERAIEREPEAAQAFSARADVYARLGEPRLAAIDRARAAYLGA